MSCDKLVFDLSQEVEGSPNVFIRKDWINILDNQNQNYQNNQCIIDTSQLANSNKYMGYREGYLAVPLLLTAVGPAPVVAGNCDFGDYTFGLKNWFGQIIHSFTLDYNGTTIVQQTPFINMWNSFKLLTTLSWADVASQGPTIGFYPDVGGSWTQHNIASAQGLEVSNNDLGKYYSVTPSFSINNYDQYTIINQAGGNVGLTNRIKWIAFDSLGGGSSSSNYGTVGVAQNIMNNIWKSNISKFTQGDVGVRPVLQISVMATIYLKHIHSFFNMCPLLKGTFMKLTMNLNNSSSTIDISAAGLISAENSVVGVGGVNPLHITSTSTGLGVLTTSVAYPLAGGSRIYFNLSVGSTCLDGNISGLTPNVISGNLSKSVYLYVPAYTFNPTFEQAYLSNNIKQIKYTDVYQYQVQNGIPSGSNFNQLITNGIANIKSVLIIPFYKNKLSAPAVPYNEYQSPFDPAGCGTTAPMVTLGNFNVQISGQNAIYNMQRYVFEEWNNQLYGQNAVNGGLTDGLTSGLINFMDFQNSYCYYYVNVERMLPVEQSVPKSVQILGTNYSTQELNLWVFIEYGVSVSIDVLTGARV